MPTQCPPEHDGGPRTEDMTRGESAQPATDPAHTDPTAEPTAGPTIGSTAHPAHGDHGILVALQGSDPRIYRDDRAGGLRRHGGLHGPERRGIDRPIRGSERTGEL